MHHPNPYSPSLKSEPPETIILFIIHSNIINANMRMNISIVSIIIVTILGY